MKKNRLLCLLLFIALFSFSKDKPDVQSTKLQSMKNTLDKLNRSVLKLAGPEFYVGMIKAEKKHFYSSLETFQKLKKIKKGSGEGALVFVIEEYTKKIKEKSSSYVQGLKNSFTKEEFKLYSKQFRSSKGTFLYSENSSTNKTSKDIIDEEYSKFLKRLDLKKNSLTLKEKSEIYQNELTKLSKLIQKNVPTDFSVKLLGNCIEITHTQVTEIYNRRIDDEGLSPEELKRANQVHKGQFKILITAQSKISEEMYRELKSWNVLKVEERFTLQKHINYSINKAGIHYKPRNEQEKKVLKQIRSLEEQFVHLPNIFWSKLSMHINVNADVVYPVTKAKECQKILEKITALFKKYNRGLSQDCFLKGNINFIY